MRTMTLYNTECGFPADMHTGKPTISPETARQFVEELEQR